MARTPSKFRRLQAELMALGIDRPYLARLMKHRNRDCIDQRMSGNVQWSLREMYALMDLLHWPYDRMHELFPKGGLEAAATGDEALGRMKADVTKFSAQLCSACGKNYKVALVGTAGENERTEISCPWCGIELGIVATARLVMASKA